MLITMDGKLVLLQSLDLVLGIGQHKIINTSSTEPVDSMSRT
jgi:hypothetical protein